MQQAARVDQVLARRKKLGVGAGEFDGRQRTLVHLRPRVREQLLGQRHGLLFHLDVFVQCHEIGIEADYAVYRQNQLLLEQQAGDLPLVGGDADVAPVQPHAETAQQRLRHRERQARSGERIVAGGQRVQGLVQVVEAQRGLSAGRKTLLHACVGLHRVGHQGVGVVTLEAGLRRGLVRPVPQPGDGGVENRNRRSARLRHGALHGIVDQRRTQRAQLQRVGRDRCPVGGVAGHGPVGDQRADRPAHARGRFRQRVAQATHHAAALCAP